ncbi:uncharacterized protein LOC110042638 isoform X2 [Orbicella faveolata]|uniref:uncharacterized protein LOC110042638 isoform X1 n=1 Tax=Orbicella faveolata TaxID=48498 RepID=UPI0009E431DC|nr:uncharacterized protein LOC110042638 isoform X1 [Orbicella faveolata]XP_020603668.1 uncharacterized protein LOC110042638 isoform X2 [Orbicella faveolata]
MKDEKRLHFTPSDVQTLRSFCVELDRLQKQLEDELKPKLPASLGDHIKLVQFEELTKSTIDRATDAGILSDEIQRFLRIARAVKLIKSSSDDEIEKLSDRLESYLIDISTFMKRVLRENRVLPPQPQDLNGLKERLDEYTRSFLEVVDKENTESGNIKDSVVDDVRNYVVVRTLAQAMLIFKGGLGHVIG